MALAANDRLVDELEKIREGMYRDQPETFNAVNSIINLLQYALCEHDWETFRTVDTPDEPSERVTRCKKCGADRLE